MTLELGDTILGRYRVVRLIGEGGMGAVYEGENIRIKRRVAIKVLHAQLAKDPAVVKRFEREAQAAGTIGSDHIVDVIDLGDLPSGDLFMVMEFLDGESLDARIQRKGVLTAGEIFPIALGLLEGLERAHSAKVIHRDLKPDNVFLTPDPKTGADFVKILDFGISKFRELDGDHKMTRTGAIMGTPYFLSPEQARGNTVIDERVDIYAVGVILYYALSGQVPFMSETFNDLLFKIALEDPPPVEGLCTGLAPDAAAIVKKAMDRDRTQRYQTAGELAEALRGWLRFHASQLTNTMVLEESSSPPLVPRAHHVTPPTVLDSQMTPQPVPMATAAGLTLSGASDAKRSTGVVVVLALVSVLLVGGGIAAFMRRGADESAREIPAAREEPPAESSTPEASSTPEPRTSTPTASPTPSATQAPPPIKSARPKSSPPKPPPPKPAMPKPSTDGRIITPSLD